MGRTLQQIAEDIHNNKNRTLTEGAPAIPQMPMQKVSTNEKDKDEQGEQDLGARIDTNRGKPTTGPSTAGKGVSGRAPKRPADGEISNEPMHTIPDPDEDSDGPMKFPKRPADASSKQYPMQSLPDKFTSLGKGPNVTEGKDEDDKKKKKIKEDEAAIEANDKKVQAQVRYEEKGDQDEETNEEIDEGIDISEDMEALFNGETLTEDFKDKAKLIFESAVNAKISAYEKKLTEAYEETLTEQVEEIKSELSEAVDDYLNYVVGQWMVENEIAIEAGLRTELTEDFIVGLRNLFLENYIDVPDEEVTVIEELTSKLDDLTDRLNEEMERNVELTKDLSESFKEIVFTNITKDLPMTQVEKLKTLSEGIEFIDEDDFTSRIVTLKDNYFPSNKAAPKTGIDLVESVQEGEIKTQPTSGRMNQYVKHLSKVKSN